MMNKRRNRILLLVCCVILSGGAGITGGLLSKQLFQIEDINQLSEGRQPTIYIDRTQSDAIRPDLERIGESHAASVLRVYKKSQPSLSDDLVGVLTGYGVALTSDGWLAVPSTLSLEDSVIIDIRGNRYTPRVVVADTRIDVMYAKMDAKDWKPVSLGTEMRRIQSGAMVRAIDDVVQVTLSAAQYPEPREGQSRTQAIKKLSKRFHVSEAGLEGSPIYSSKEFLGLLSSNQKVIPASYIRDSFGVILKTGRASTLTIDATYLDNASVPWKPEVSGMAVGATLITVQRLPSLVREGGKPAIKLQPGDIVLMINNEAIDGNRSLSELLSHYRPGDTLQIVYQKKGALEKERGVMVVPAT